MRTSDESAGSSALSEECASDGRNLFVTLICELLVQKYNERPIWIIRLPVPSKILPAVGTVGPPSRVSPMVLEGLARLK